MLLGIRVEWRLENVLDVDVAASKSVIGGGRDHEVKPGVWKEGL